MPWYEIWAIEAACQCAHDRGHCRQRGKDHPDSLTGRWACVTVVSIRNIGKSAHVWNLCAKKAGNVSQPSCKSTSARTAFPNSTHQSQPPSSARVIIAQLTGQAAAGKQLLVSVNSLEYYRLNVLQTKLKTIAHIFTKAGHLR